MNVNAHELAAAIYQNLPGEGFTLDQDCTGTWLITGPTTQLAIADDGDGLTWTFYAHPVREGGVGGYDYDSTDGTSTTDWSEEEVLAFVSEMTADLTA